jgi:CHAD domain-containing protein
LNAASVPAEIEAKLLVRSESDLRAIARLTELGPYRLERRPTQRLHSLYLDTPQFALSRSGVALRLRRHGGRWEATVKWSGIVVGVRHQRPELTVALPRKPELLRLPAELHSHLAVLVRAAPLRPILITDITRGVLDVFALRDPAHPAAEIALDRVVYRTPNGQRVGETELEVEIEQRHGSEHDVDAVSELLRGPFDLDPSPETKLGRGLRAVLGERAPRPESPQPVRARDNVVEATRKIVALQLTRLRAYDPGTRIGENAEALHDMRVATRRLRAALRLFKPGFAVRLREELERELRWLGRTLGPVRDLDVQLASVAAYAAGLPEGYRRGIAPYRRHLEQTRAERRAEMLTVLDSKRYFQLLDRLERFAAAGRRAAPRHPAAHQSIAAYGAEAIDRAFRHVRKRGKKVGPNPDPADLHLLRIRSKQLRYLLEFLCEITGRPGRRLTKKLVRLQDLLGTFNDAVVAANLVCTYLDGAGRNAAPSTALALQALAQAALHRAEKARAEFDTVWRRFSNKRNLAQRRALLERLRTEADDTEKHG